MRWWIKYLGAVAALVGSVYPAGIVREGRPRLMLCTDWKENAGKRVLRLVVRFSGIAGGRVFEEEMERTEKVGKRKNWVGGREGMECTVEVVRRMIESSDLVSSAYIHA